VGSITHDLAIEKTQEEFDKSLKVETHFVEAEQAMKKLKEKKRK